MYKHKMTYTDYNGEERETELYFNLNAAELAKMEAKTPGGLESYLRGIIEAKDNGAIWDILEQIVLASYGKRMPDGSFAKENGVLAQKFTETKAYPDFMVWLFENNTANATEFLRQVIPSEDEMRVGKPKLEVVNNK